MRGGAPPNLGIYRVPPGIVGRSLLPSSPCIRNHLNLFCCPPGQNHMLQVYYNTFKLYLFAIEDLHRQHKIPLKLSKMYHLQKVLTWWSSLKGFPNWIQILDSIHNNFQLPQSYNVDHKLLWAAFTRAFFGFLRASEVTCDSSSFAPTAHICLRVITFILNTESPYHMLVSITQFKTNPFRKGCTLTIARSTNSICSVMGMRDYPLQFKPAATGPVFIFTNCMASGSPVPPWLRSSVLHCKVVAYLLITISHTISVLVQLLLQPQQVRLRGLSRYWAAGAQTLMSATSEPLKNPICYS